VLARLESLCARYGLDDLAGRLDSIQRFMDADLARLEEILAEIPARGQSVVHASARHLLERAGKRVRPLCVAMAARVGDGFSPRARELAVAVELVHSATLLHDDVVDLGETRRGAATVRAVFGNAASIYAGDWLFVEALRRVRLAGMDDVLDRMLAVIEEMILAEAVQLERRGRVEPDRAAYFRVVEGKTAALFRWAMFAGGRAGGLGEDRCRALERYGQDLGVAFQAIDDLLDWSEDGVAIGKTLLSDLREGKMTYPLILGFERDAGIATLVREAFERGDGVIDDATGRRLRGMLEHSGALEECRALGRDRARAAVAALAPLPDGEATWALAVIAEATADRRR
jgi:octaprenyl-diphosphate synthase